MTDQNAALREAARAVLDRWDSLDWKAAPTADYMNRLRAALAAAPQPASADREALVEVIEDALYSHSDERGWELTGTAQSIADALLARGLRLPGGETMTSAARDVLAERQRQINVEGWTPEDDDRYENGDLASAAACYIINVCEGGDPEGEGRPPFGWPWDAKWWKPTAPRRDLVKAGALILAEIERLDRAAIRVVEGGDDAA